MPSISMVRKPPGKPGAMHSALPVTAGGTFWPPTHRLFGGFFGPDMRSNSRINAAHESLTKTAGEVLFSLQSGAVFPPIYHEYTHEYYPL